MFLGSQSKTATLIELKLFGSDHMTSESDHENKNFGGFSDQNLRKIVFGIFWHFLTFLGVLKPN